MRQLNIATLFAVLLAAGDAMACRELVKFDAHLTGDAPGWFKNYRVATIVEIHIDRLVVNVRRRFDGSEVLPDALTLPFIPNEQAYAVCPTKFEVGQTYLVHIRMDGAHEQISRYNGYDIPASDPKYSGYVRDLERASAASSSLERTRGK